MRKFLFFLSGYFFSTIPGITQTAQWNWAKTPTGASTGNISGMHDVSTAVDGLGNIYVVGNFLGSTTFGTVTLTEKSSATTDIYVVKYDASGKVLWAKSAGGEDLDRALEVAADSVGNVYITGYFKSTSFTFAGTTLANNRPYGGEMKGNEMFLLKYDPSGTEVWIKSPDKISGGEDGNSVTTDPKGNIIVVGSFYRAPITFGAYTLPFSSNVDGYVVKYDPNGNVLWAKNVQGGGQEDISDVTTDSKGNVLITGCFSDNVVFGKTNLKGGEDGGMFIAKYDSQGNFAWANFAPNINIAANCHVATDKNDNVFVTGDFWRASTKFGSITITNFDPRSRDMYVAKYSPSGEVLWAHGQGALLNDAGCDLTTDAAGNVYVLGTTANKSLIIGTTTGTCANSGSIFVVKYSPSGDVTWSTSACVNNAFFAHKIVSDNKGHLFVTGYYYGAQMTFGNVTLTTPKVDKYGMNINSYHMFFARLDSVQ